MFVLLSVKVLNTLSGSQMSWRESCVIRCQDRKLKQQARNESDSQDFNHLLPQYKQESKNREDANCLLFHFLHGLSPRWITTRREESIITVLREFSTPLPPKKDASCFMDIGTVERNGERNRSGKVLSTVENNVFRFPL